MKNAYDVVDQYLSSFGIYNKILETGWLIKDRNLFLTFLEARSLKSRGWQGSCSSEAYEEILPALPSFWWIAGVFGIPWLVDKSLNPPSLCGILSVSVSRILLYALY